MKVKPQSYMPKQGLKVVVPRTSLRDSAVTCQWDVDIDMAPAKLAPPPGPGC